MLKDAAGNMQVMNMQPMIFLTRNVFFFPQMMHFMRVVEVK
jgi:hypothetical protein